MDKSEEMNAGKVQATTEKCMKLNLMNMKR